MRKHELELRIAELKRQIDTFEIDQDKYKESYKELIDERGPVFVAGMKFTASRILEELDPIAFRCGLNDYVDSLSLSDDEDYQALESELEELEDELNDIVEAER